MPLCSICRGLDFAHISRTGFSEFFRPGTGHGIFFYDARDANLRRPESVLTPYHKDLESLNASARLCDLCRLVQGSVDASIMEMGHSVLRSRYELWIGSRDGFGGFQVLGIDMKRVTERLECILMGGFGFYLKSDSPIGTVITGTQVPSSPCSPRILETIKGWRKQCTEQHQHMKPRSKSLPRRVLEITNCAQEVALYVSDITDGEYATLSHCWGSSQPATLTFGTIEKLRAGIRVSDLSRTFQDAIWLIYQLGIRYLWIDSLCIIQDDPDDWIRESARMCDIYQNSSLTIAASRATHSQEGFLGERMGQTYISVPIQAKGISGEVFAFAVSLKYVSNVTRLVHLEDEPLTDRGWALQERFLSPRTLHFCRSRICFECEHSFIMEDYYSPGQFFYAPKVVLGDHPASGTKGQHLQGWRNIVTKYSRCKLTIEDDKLPALAGLAARFSSNLKPGGSVSVRESRYLAGLWSDDMLRGMCWEISPFGPSGVRPQKYRAPTWSWASLDGEIDYKTSWVNSINELAIIQDAHVDLDSSKHHFGRVTGGWVHLKALKLRPYSKPNDKSFWIYEEGAVFRIVTQWDSEQYHIPDYGTLVHPVLGDMELFVIPLGWVDHHLQASDGDEAHCLLGPFFLIIKAVEHNIHSHAKVPGFQRVGFGTGIWVSSTSNENCADREGLKRLILEKYVIAKEQGRLESILLL